MALEGADSGEHPLPAALKTWNQEEGRHFGTCISHPAGSYGCLSPFESGREIVNFLCIIGGT
jgi:hypothetical protein